MAAARIAIRDPSFRKEAIRFLALPPYPVVYGLKAQPRTIKISIPLNPSYESNVLKSNTTVTPDRVFGIGAGVQMTGPGLPGRPLDVVGYSLSGTSARYDANPSKSVDLINGAMAYQIFLGAFGGRKTIDSTHPPPSGLSIGLITTDTLLVGFQNSVATVPIFRGYSSDLFTPQVVLSRQNIDLSDGKACFTSKDVAKKAGSFCTYADLSLGVGQTFSDYGTQENANASVAATVGRRPDGTDFTIGFQIIATGKYYEKYPGGRRDSVLQEGPTIRYAASKCVNASLAANFY